LFDGTSTNSRGAGVSLQWSFGADIEAIDDMEDPAKPRNLGNAAVDQFADLTVAARDLGDETNHQTTVLAADPGVPSPPPEAYRVDVGPGRRDWSGFDLFTFRVCADSELASEATIAAITTPLAPRRPVFHRIRGVAPPNDNVTVLRLETMSIPISSLTGIDKTKVASVAIAATSGFAKHQFFDSLQLVRR
jgi:hypothetical protein